jgi:3-isopropylmalate dehydratase small subunit
MLIHGHIWSFGNDINTDVIIPSRYLNIIVAGKNFGCGSSREHAPIAIKAAGIHAVIAKSFARIFYRNAFNIGLPIFESEEGSEKIKEADEIEIDADKGIIKNLSTQEDYKANPIPPFMQELIDAGGLIEWTKQRLSTNDESNI